MSSVFSVPSEINFASVSHSVKALQGKGLSDTLASLMLDTLAIRARKRVREELDRKGVTQRDIAGQLKWSQAKVAQKLSGRTPWTLEELDSLCFIAGIPPTEAVRDRGLEFCAELAPYELRLLENFRTLTPALRDVYLTLLNAKAGEARQARPRKPIIGKPRIR